MFSEIKINVSSRLNQGNTAYGVQSPNVVLMFTPGTGIFISPKGAVSGGGSVGATLLLWGVGGIITILGKFFSYICLC